jgi:hypothetical protein
MPVASEEQKVARREGGWLWIAAGCLLPAVILASAPAAGWRGKIGDVRFRAWISDAEGLPQGLVHRRYVYSVAITGAPPVAPPPEEIRVFTLGSWHWAAGTGTMLEP